MIAWFLREICIGNSMICIDIWHKYHERYFKIVIRNLSQFWNITSGIYAKYHIQIMLLFFYTTTLKRFVIFTCSYFTSPEFCTDQFVRVNGKQPLFCLINQLPLRRSRYRRSRYVVTHHRDLENGHYAISA